MRGSTTQGSNLRLLTAICALTLTACGPREAAVGDADQIVIASAPELWEEFGPRLRAALEPTRFPLPDEKGFELTAIDPAGADWTEQRRARQLLLIGRPDDPWIAEALERRRPPPEIPSQTALPNLWATGQHVLVLLLPVDKPRAALEAGLVDLRATFEKWYREDVVGRMFAEGHDHELRDTLHARGGFDLLLPAGYRWHAQEDVYLFRPAEADTAALARTVMVTWRSPMPDALSTDALFQWRAQISAAHYGARQSVNPARVRGGQTTLRGNVVMQLLGTWSRRGARGPFLLRAVMCPSQDRMYLLDAWVHAPEQEKKEYMVQLELILNSFRCGSGPE